MAWRPGGAQFYRDGFLPGALRRRCLWQRIFFDDTSISRRMNSLAISLRRALWLAFLLLPMAARAQWMTQSIQLHPGWNAVYLNVSAPQDTLENLVGAASPISEVWLWVPSSSETRIVSSPQQPVSGSDWKQWSKVQGPPNAFALRANTTYLVRNSSAQNYLWNIKGQPVPPVSQWTASGLNFLGFSTRPNTPPLFANFLAPAPGVGAAALKNADIYYYPGGEAAGVAPVTAQIFTANTIPVTRGQAFWMRKQDNSDNRYFGPFDVVLQDARGVVFSDTRGAYSLRLRNQIAATNTVNLTLRLSEVSPAGQAIAPPSLLLRTTRDSSTLKYGFANLPVNGARSFTLAPAGTPGSEVEVVIGLDRSNMPGSKGAAFAGILRLEDTTLGQLQINLPVSATLASTDGLWVGNASITQVGNYLKTYAKATNAVDFANKSAELDAYNDANKSVTFPSGPWTATNIATNGNRAWQALASSADGVNLAAAAFGGGIYTSTNSGTTWKLSGAPATNWQAVASSADGASLAAVVKNGQIYTSTNAGAAWTPRENVRNWSSIASSTNGQFLAAAVDGGDLFTSTDGGATWFQRTPISSQSWKSIASSADGKKLVAVINGGVPYGSTDAGTNWVPLAGAPSANWQVVASSADGRKLVAAANPGAIYTSVDFGASWDIQTGAPSTNWLALACSRNGNVIVAAAPDASIYISTDSGATWTARESSRAWSSVASASDGSKLFAVENGGANQFYSVAGNLTAPSLTYDSNSQQILTGGAKYLVASFDSELGSVPNPFPLRLIVHRGADGTTKLLQRVFVGLDAVTTNGIVTLQESKLHPAYLAQARRISAVHLPLSGDGWPLKGSFAAGGIMNAVLTDAFNDQASNPFLHTYHPDHDNLDALFQPISKPGVESYDINRQITLSFTPPDASDFNSRTAGAASMQGVYLENIVLKGSDNQSRTIVTKGSFVLNRISSIDTLQ